jgi:DNA-binding GntR family transcriptional regulator
MSLPLDACPIPSPLRGTSLHDGVAARLRELVFEHELAPGLFIDEKALAARWQISRTPLREALKVLAAEGLVELVPRRGGRVVALTDADADELFPVMAMLEGRCAWKPRQRATTSTIWPSCSPCTTSWNATPPRPMRRLLPRQPRLPFAGAGGGRQPLARPRHRRPAPLHAADARPPAAAARAHRRVDLNEHRVLMDAFEQRDADRAERAMHDHLMAQLVALKAAQALEGQRQHAGRPPGRRGAPDRTAAPPAAGLPHGCCRERGEANGPGIAAGIVEQIDALADEPAPASSTTWRASSPDPQQVLAAAGLCQGAARSAHLIALTQAAEPPRQELLRRLNRAPGGTAAILRLRRALLRTAAAPAGAAGVEPTCCTC